MVTTNTAKLSKINAKIPVSKVGGNKLGLDLKIPVSPNSEGVSLQDEVFALRARNKVLTEALKAVNETATKKFKKNFDLVWYARNRCRYPNHEDSKRIEESAEYQEDLEMLRHTAEGDYHHGFHSGVLAASRMFKEQSDILHINEHAELNDKLIDDASRHLNKIKEAKDKFERRRSLPQVTENEFPDQV